METDDLNDENTYDDEKNYVISVLKGAQKEFDNDKGADVEVEIITEQVHWLRLIAICCWNFGVTFGYNAEFVLGTPIFVTLGMSRFWTSFAWLAGPVSGLLQPFIGIWSDRTALGWGRRKPFIAYGVFLGVVGMLAFANPILLAKVIGLGGNKNAEIFFAIAALWILNIGLNIAQGPAMALIADLCPQSQQKMGQAFSSVIGGSAGVICYFLGFLNPVYLFYASIVVLIIFTLPTLIFAKELTLEEIQQRRKELGVDVDSEEQKGGLVELKDGIVNMKKPIIILVIAWFFTNMCISPMQFYLTDYFGEAVFDGDPEASQSTSGYENYLKGVSYGSLAFAINAIITVIVSMLIPSTQKIFGVKIVYITGQLIASICSILVAFPFFRTVVASEILFSLFGILNAISNVIPYSLLGELISKKECGVYFGLFNAVQVIAQMAANLSASTAMAIFGSTTAGMFVGGIWGFIGIIPIIFLILPKRAQSAEEYKENIKQKINEEVTPN
eukprot:TRINITY_DN15114_c0_g1_i1.p1 TRINITY_DN15114_c0_g1~~TRINITY_DN15114_c0_g1_i1.p1  ORF type:complete len:501 (-),score=156.62 TRINITY_DN15114_c0_g1_i1:137-1639(-)